MFIGCFCDSIQDSHIIIVLLLFFAFVVFCYLCRDVSVCAYTFHENVCIYSFYCDTTRVSIYYSDSDSNVIHQPKCYMFIFTPVMTMTISFLIVFIYVDNNCCLYSCLISDGFDALQNVHCCQDERIELNWICFLSILFLLLLRQLYSHIGFHVTKYICANHLY